ncbi:MFS transporter [Phreatobacter aquaticus]|uniref:MFS transporter n=1 Tax=Phreatobacter aquaticus TaxID=2570229 RepID=A0A4D7QM01_9HYPH|nr:MFS transporter [Phreatobacter aquaticus]QCK87551.1 MFS transporter [Phreatobacter aquaticus]
MSISPQTAQPVQSGPLKAEAVLLGQVSFVHLISHIHFMTLPALLPILPARLGVSFIDLGAAITLYNFVSFLVQTPMGFATDRFGARRVLTAGLIIGSVSLLVVAIVPTYGCLLVAMAALGLANGVYHPCDYALLSNGIDGSRMGRAFSIHTFAGYLGTAITPPLLLGTAAFAGLSSAFAVAGLIGLAGALMLILVNPDPARPDTAADAGERASEPARPVSRLALVTPTVLSLMAMFVLLALSTSGISSFSVSALVMGYGTDLSTANAALTGFLFASAIGVLAGGALADRTAHHGLVAAGAYGLTAIISLTLALTQPPALGLLVMLGAAGFLTGIITPSRDMMVRAAAPKGSEGIVFGIVSTGFNIGGLIGPLLYAWLLDSGQTSAIFAVAALFMVLTVTLAIVQDLRART